VIRIIAAGSALALAGCGGGCNQPPLPSSETCDGTAHGTVTSLDIGRFDGTTYTQYQDGDVIPLIFGGQGAQMLVVNLRARGSDLGDCLPQSTVVARVADGTGAGSQTQALVIDQVLPDTWISGDQLLIDYDLWSGIAIDMETEAGGVLHSVRLWVDYVAEVDAGLPPDATPAPSPDAAP
jgi:hypothetical protein